MLLMGRKTDVIVDGEMHGEQVGKDCALGRIHTNVSRHHGSGNNNVPQLHRFLLQCSHRIVVDRWRTAHPQPDVR